MNKVDPDQCRDRQRENIPWLVNGSLSDVEAEAVRAHIEGCAVCRADVELHMSMRSAVLGGAVTPIRSATKAADIFGVGRTGVSRRARSRRVASKWLAVAAGIMIVGVALLFSLYPGNDTDGTNQVFETATSAGSVTGIDYVLQVQFEDTVSEPERARIAAQLEGAVKWTVNDSGVYEVHLQLATPSLEVLQDYERRTDALAGVQSAEFTALQLPIRQVR